jgi:hypothetical protein
MGSKPVGTKALKGLFLKDGERKEKVSTYYKGTVETYLASPYNLQLAKHGTWEGGLHNHSRPWSFLVPVHVKLCGNRSSIIHFVANFLT